MPKGDNLFFHDWEKGASQLRRIAGLFVYKRNVFFFVVDFRPAAIKKIDRISPGAASAPAERQNKISEVNSMKNQASNFTEFRKYYLSEYGTLRRRMFYYVQSR